MDTPNPQTGSQEPADLQHAGEPVVNPTSAWVLRLIGEASDLDQRGQKLSLFIRENPLFKTLPNRDRLLMTAQLRCMADLFAILNERIGRATNPEQASAFDKANEAQINEEAKAFLDDKVEPEVLLPNDKPQREVGDGA